MKLFSEIARLAMELYKSKYPGSEKVDKSILKEYDREVFGCDFDLRRDRR